VGHTALTEEQSLALNQLCSMIVSVRTKVVVFNFSSSSIETRILLAWPRDGPKGRQKSDAAEARQPLGVEELCALRAAEPDGPITVLNLGEPVIASDGFFARKTLTIPGPEAVGIVVVHLIRLAARASFPTPPK
jgi:hypothetical protein